MKKKLEKTGLELRQIKKKQGALIDETANQLISDLKPYTNKRFDELQEGPGLALLDIRKKEEAFVKEAANRLISQLEADIGKPFGELQRPFLVGMVESLLEIFCEKQALSDRHAEKFRLLTEETLVRVADAGEKMVKARRRAFKKRVENRPDQVDKRAAQEAVLAKIEGYSTIAAAVRDLQANPQFKNRKEATLRRWTKEVLGRQPKAGRPPKEQQIKPKI